MGPTPSQVEISLIGPGYGECSLIHLGAGEWIVIDSCIDKQSGEPAAITYFNSIGVNPSEAIKLIIATHWHDDHIGGLSSLLEIATNSRFCCSAALGREEFLATVLPYADRQNIKSSTGVREISEVWKVLGSRNGKEGMAISAVTDRRVYSIDATSSGHGLPCSVWTLSPSDQQINKSLLDISQLIPTVRETKRRFPAPSKTNYMSVVTLVEIGDFSILLGGDLEESKQPGLGWGAIVSSGGRPATLSSVFKIPHHGSENGHNDDVWQGMLAPNPYAFLTPFNRGSKKLPSKPDVKRIDSLTDNAYSTARLMSGSVRRRSPVVEKTIKETVTKIRIPEPTTGIIRLRSKGSTPAGGWDVDLFRGACPLAQCIA